MKIDKRKKYLIGLDTETCNTIKENNKLNFKNGLVYDIGWIVTDKKGNIYEERSFIVEEIFFKEKDLMSSCYYYEKIPKYKEEIKQGKRQVKKFFEIYQLFNTDLKKYNINTVFAHNTFFDYTVLNNTFQYLCKRKYFFPYNLILWDTMRMAQNAIGIQKTYQKFCINNGYMTKHKNPRPQFTAEILYRYISKNNTFIENHTGLEDVKIEIAILVYCFRQKKKMRKELFNRQVEQNVYFNRKDKN